MANRITDPYLNPVKFHALDPAQLPNYVSRFVDDWAFRRTIQPWEERKCFLQPWQRCDSVRLQYISNFNPITLQLRNEEGQLVASQNFTTFQQLVLQPDYWIRQIDFSLAPYPAGLYYFQRIAAGVTTVSEPFELFENPDPSEIFPDNDNPTILINYTHYEPYGGIKFQSPFNPIFRIYGWLPYDKPGSEDTIYKDQLRNVSMIRSVPYDVHLFILGGKEGVPPWVIKRVNRMFGCSNLKLDSRLWTKNDEGAAFEPNKLQDYPMSSYTIEVVEKLNPDSVVTENDVVIEGIAAAALIIDNKGFGMSEQEGYTEILSLQ